MYLHAAEPLRADTVTCIPRLRGGGGGGGGVRRRPRQQGGAPPAPTSSVSVIDRVRDVLLLLAMLSAASSPSPKAGAGRLHTTTTQAAGAPTRAASVRMSPSYSESYPSDAVDDCIEFLKRSAAGAGAPATVPAVPEPVSSAPS